MFFNFVMSLRSIFSFTQHRINSFSISLGFSRFFRSYFKFFEFKEFNKTIIIPFALVGYETDYSQRALME